MEKKYLTHIIKRKNIVKKRPKKWKDEEYLNKEEEKNRIFMSQRYLRHLNISNNFESHYFTLD